MTFVGTYRDDDDGAAIKINSDGTGRYVYADPTDTDTDDSLNWKKVSTNTYSIRLNDSNVSSDLTAKLHGKTLVITGGGDWNTETFTKNHGNFSLDEFLSDHDHHSTNNSNNGRVINSADQAAHLVAHSMAATDDVYSATPVKGGYRVTRSDMPGNTAFVHYDGSVTWSNGETQSYSDVSKPDALDR